MVRGYASVLEFESGHGGDLLLVNPGFDRSVLVREPISGNVGVLHQHLRKRGGRRGDQPKRATFLVSHGLTALQTHLEDRAEEMRRRSAGAGTQSGGGIGHVGEARELRYDLGLQVRPVPAPQLAASEAHPGQPLRLRERPLGDRPVDHLGESAPFNGARHHRGQPHGRRSGEQLEGDDPEGVEVRLGPQRAGALVLGIHVVERAGQHGLPVLRHAVRHHARHELGKADVADLAHQVAVEQDVARFQVPVDDGLRLGAVQEGQPARHLEDDADSDVPGERPRPLSAEEQAVLDAAVLHVLVHQAAALRAGPQQHQQVRVPQLAENLHLRRKNGGFVEPFFLGRARDRRAV